jgi:phosphoenolpyruvate carboxykinase (GTP)
VQPDDIYWCDGSEEEYARLCQQLVDAGTFKKLNPAKRPGSFLACQRSGRRGPRVEDRTYICSEKKENAGPTNNWMAPAEMRTRCSRCSRLHEGPHHVCGAVQHGPAGLAHRAHRHRTFRQPYVAVNMKIMTRMGKAVYDVLGVDGEFVPCVHTVGAPLEPARPT